MTSAMLLPKTNILRDRRWLDFQHSRRCTISGAYGTADETIDPAHIGALGTSIKRRDDETLPLLHRFHKKGHDRSEIAMWRGYLPDSVLHDALVAWVVEGTPFDSDLAKRITQIPLTWRSKLPDDVILTWLRALGRREYRLWKEGKLPA